MKPRRVVCALVVLALLPACFSEADVAEEASVETAQPTVESDVQSAAATGSGAPDPAATTQASATPTATASDVAAGDEAAAVATRAVFASIGADDPGCTIAVRRGDDIVFAEAYGAASLDPAVPMTTSTVVDIASTSKQFTATSILMLADRGLVALDAPVSTYLPDLPDWSDEVTVLQMVHHTSGIPDYGDLLLDDGVEFEDVATVEMAIDVLDEVTELEFSPGAGWEYSNSNYFLLAEIVNAVTGDDLGDFLAAEVFQPLGMKAVMDPVAVIPGKAKSYEFDDGEWIVADSPWQPLGDGAIQTTPSELLKFASEYWQPSIGPDDVNERRFANAPDTNDGGRYGFGIIESVEGGRRIVEHDGAWGGFVTLFAVEPDARLAVAITCTAPESDPEAIESPRWILDVWL